MKRKTKIVCTLGPAVDSREQIARLIDAGMNCARINCSHGDWDTRRRWIEWVRELSPEAAPVGVLVDLQGPKFRLDRLPGDERAVVEGESLQVGGKRAGLPMSDAVVLEAIQAGDRGLVGDGDVELRVIESTGGGFTARVVRPGNVRSRQGITVVGKSFDVPALTPADLADAEQAAACGADYIALSYVRSASDLVELRRHVDRFDRSIGLCAKIETRSAIKELGDILQVSDLIMVARGDMGLQMDLEDVPLAQKRIIRRCLASGKPVITATQMMESMIHVSRPTRAEVADIANAILDGTDAVMLSAETARGDYPIEAVQYMGKIAEKAESAFDEGELLRGASGGNYADAANEAVAMGVAQLSSCIRPKAIITNTSSGATARQVSRFRPRAPILAATYDARTQGRLSVVWGVEAVRVPLLDTTDALIQNTLDDLVRRKKLKVGDTVVISAGVPAGTPGNTNLILVQEVR